MASPTTAEYQFLSMPVNRQLWQILQGLNGMSSLSGVAGTTSQVTVGTTAATILAAAATARKVSIYNNSPNYAWLVIGAGTPVKDSTPSSSPQTGNGYGLQLSPGGYYESPIPIKEAVQAVASAAGSKLTVVTYG
jgi:hypothetical protein